MPHLEISQQSFTLALVAYANFTATPTTGCSINNLYAGLKGNLVDSLGANSVPVVVNSVPSAGVVQLLTLSDNGTRTSTDLTAYDGGSVYFETQLVWVESVNVGVDSAAGGDLSGTYPSPEVVALHDPDEKLSLGDIADGEFLKRSGNAIVSGAVAPATPTTPGTVPQYPIPQSGVDGLVSALARTVRSVAGATDTLAATDTERLGTLYVRYTAAGGCAVGLEKHATVAYAIPCAISLRASGAGDVAITPVAPATINGSASAVTVGSGTAATLVQVAEDVWETIPAL